MTEWLERHDFADCIASFESNRISLELLGDLTDADLRELGMSALGDRKRFLRLAALAAPEEAGPPRRKVSEQLGVAAPASDPGPASSAAAAERRQLSVVFCDLVDATRLSTALDPEDLRAVLRAYHDAVALDAARFEGFVAQYLGDGVLIYFGHPLAHEDDAERAVLASLAIVERVRRLEPRPGLRLESRIGIATGMVVVEEIGRGTPGAEFSATGETPNLAARLQSVAGPGEVVISEATRQLLGTAFELTALGRRSLKGFRDTMEVWRAIRARDVPVRFLGRHHSVAHAIVGRHAELSLLHERWADACAGRGSAVILSRRGRPRKVATVQRVLHSRRIGRRRLRHAVAVFSALLGNSALPGRPPLDGVL